MLNTKFDLYKTEWLDLVFDDRNKAYGAYDLRNHYARNLNKAMAITFAVLLAASTFIYISSHQKAVIPETTIVDVVLPSIKAAVVEPQKKIEPPKAAVPIKPQPTVTTIQHLPPVVKPDELVTKEPVKTEDLAKAAVGTVTVKGVDVAPGGNAPEPAPVTGGGGTGTAPAADNTVHNSAGLEVMPEPVGGFAAFGKFLGKNLRFPGAAQDAGVAGRVTLTFVIEKNGDITNINIDNPAGYGFDQEATRVLKLAKAWKPGIQNGQPVRVRYSIPINFQLPAE
ncbi:hypothetical protein A0256_18385 [Mucilaginibacter sp. PAMC 26640]|nr:hypothetical protein A0256_18385 [Mucilaginibacter sp. PAMC 26640]